MTLKRNIQKTNFPCMNLYSRSCNDLTNNATPTSAKAEIAIEQPNIKMLVQATNNPKEPAQPAQLIRIRLPVSRTSASFH